MRWIGRLGARSDCAKNDALHLPTSQSNANPANRLGSPNRAIVQSTRAQLPTLETAVAEAQQIDDCSERMHQIVAEELSVPLERVTVRAIDTDFTPFDRSTGSSRSTTVMGKAVLLAALDARRQLVELAAEHFEAPPDAITLGDGRAAAGGKEITYGEMIHRHFAMQGGELIGPADSGWGLRLRC